MLIVRVLKDNPHLAYEDQEGLFCYTLPLVHQDKFSFLRLMDSGTAQEKSRLSAAIRSHYRNLLPSFNFQ